MSGRARAHVLLTIFLKWVLLEPKYLGFLVVKFKLVKVLFHAVPMVIQHTEIVTGRSVPPGTPLLQEGDCGCVILLYSHAWRRWGDKERTPINRMIT